MTNESMVKITKLSSRQTSPAETKPGSANARSRNRDRSAIGHHGGCHQTRLRSNPNGLKL